MNIYLLEKHIHYNTVHHSRRKGSHSQENLHDKNSSNSSNEHHETNTSAACSTLKLRWHEHGWLAGLACASGHRNVHAGSILSRASRDVGNASRWVRSGSVSGKGNGAESHVHRASNRMLHRLLGVAADRLRGVLSSRRRRHRVGCRGYSRVCWVLRSSRILSHIRGLRSDWVLGRL